MPDFGSIVSYYDSEANGPIPAIVEADNGDGTYDVVLFDIERTERRSANSVTLAADFASGDALDTNFILDDVGGGGASLWTDGGTYLAPTDVAKGMEVPGVIQAEPVGLTLAFFGVTPVVQPSAIADAAGAAGLLPGTDMIDFASWQAYFISLESKINEILAAKRSLGSIAT